MDKRPDIEAQLRQVIADSGMSINQLAAESGLFYQSVHGFVRGDRGITLASAAKLARALGLELRPVRRGTRTRKG